MKTKLAETAEGLEKYVHGQNQPVKDRHSHNSSHSYVILFTTTLFTDQVQLSLILLSSRYIVGLYFLIALCLESNV